eukprot:NODE_271_length_12205_cov_0.703205.p10 type:complete len:136 gc:universal NODE_271_length_12205_cov_0.703205:7849-7442(-)
MYGDISRPNSFSSSPWVIHSSKTSLYHFSYILNCFVALDISAIFIIILDSSRTSSLTSGSSSFSEFILFLKKVSSCICCTISVARTISTTSSLNCFISCFVKFIKKLESSCFNSLNAVETWWFSSTALSLYKRAL